MATTSSAGITTSTITLDAKNGRDTGMVSVEFLVPKEEGNYTASILDFKINRVEYPDQVDVSLRPQSIDLKYADLISDFTIIQETNTLDKVGANSQFDHINDRLESGEAQLGLLESGSETDAFMHLEPGDSWGSDEDTFVLRADRDGDYQLIVKPHDTSVFHSNIVATIHDPAGSWMSLILNEIGSDVFAESSSASSDVFSLRANADYYLSFSVRSTYGHVASEPEPYQLELVAVAKTADAAFL